MPKKNKNNSNSSHTKRVLNEDDSKRVGKGEDMYGYGEQKKPLNLSLTPTTIDILNKVANRECLSKSELIEQWARDKLAQTFDTDD